MKKIGIVYWPKRGSVELNAKRIQVEWGETVAELIPLRDMDMNLLKDYTYLIFGCSTVGADSWRDAYTGNPWLHFYTKLGKMNLDFRGKKVALYGLGDQVLYPRHYVDEMARLAKELQAHGAVIVGKWPAEGYEHTESKAYDDGFFLGLALDEHNQAELSEGRIREWVSDLKKNHFR
ncbi:MAG: flavodoxin domain-containing protein [Bacteroidales bacterium]|nr:flavodoxin domain-containing protein [Lentimicrobiaceae bacterium]MDD5696009.1 flavodoxin domain-containing protein [Bacteroidales bacterium]